MVRESISKLVTIENPTKAIVNIKNEYFTSENDNITFTPNHF